MATDGKLRFVGLVNAKHAEGYRMLFRYFYKPLVSFALNYLSEKEEAEDVVADLFSVMWEGDHTFDSYERLRNFLYMSVRNSAINVLKHVKVKEKYISAWEGEWGEEDERKLVEEEVYRLMFEVLDTFPPRCKEIFDLVLKGKKNEEIAALLHISVLTVKTQKNRGLKILKERLGDLFLLLPGILFLS